MKNPCKPEFAGSDDESEDESELSFVNSRPILPLDTSIGSFPPVKRPLHADKLLHVFEVAEHGTRGSVIVLTKTLEAARSLAAQQKWFSKNAQFAATQIKQEESKIEEQIFVASYVQLLGQVALNTPGKLRHVTDDWLRLSFERCHRYEQEAHELGLLTLYAPAVMSTSPLFGEYYLTPFALMDSGWQERESEILQSIGSAHTYLKLLYWLIGGINLFDDLADQEPSLLSQWAPSISLRSAETLRSLLDRSVNELSMEAIQAELKKNKLHANSMQTTPAASPAAGTANASINAGLKRVIGRQEIKQTLMRDLIIPARNSSSPELSQKNLNPDLGACTSVLFMGPPGCGKTHLVKCIAEELQVLLIQVRPSDIASMYVRESLLRLREFFDDAVKHKPSILFFDELDFLAPDRNRLVPGQDYKIEEIDELLIGLELAKEQGLFVLAATNQPFLIDHSIFRQGRFDKIIYLAPPNQDDRVELLKHFLQNRPLVDDLDLESFGERLEGFSVADLRALIDDAVGVSFSLGKCPISAAILSQALSRVQASISVGIEKRFEKFVSRGYSE